MIPRHVRLPIACHAELLGQTLGGVDVDSLAAAVRATFTEAGRVYANEIFASGPVELRLGHGGAWTSRHDVGLRRAYVFDLSPAGMSWGHAGPEPLPCASTGANPRSIVEIEIRGTGTGSVELGLLQRTAQDSILWIRYQPIAVTAATVARALLANDRIYPWGYALALDIQGDGVTDAYVYPGGQAPSDARPLGARRFQLLPSRPNPFHPATTIRYVLPAAASVTVDIHDVRGRLVARAFHGTQPPGAHALRWPAAGAVRPPSGTYFARVVTPWGVASQKLTLVR